MPIPNNTSLRLVQTIEDAFDMKRWLSEDRNREVIGLDTETSGLSAYTPGARLRMIQLGDYNNGWAVPWDQWGGVAMECLNAWQGPIALHNAPFDIKFLEKFAGWKPPWHRLHDTMIHSKIMRPGQPATLKGNGERFVDPRTKAGQEKLDEAFKRGGYTWDTVPIGLEAYWAYAALDPVVTAHLWKHDRADLAYPEVYDLEMATLRICATMEARGARIDLNYCVKKRDELEEYTDNLKKRGQEEFGLMLSSSQQLVEYFQNNNARFTMLTPKGQPSANAEQMELFSIDSDPKVSTLAKWVLEMRKADKLRGSYFENFLNNHIDGVVHPSINTMGAITGRMSINNPALQTLPSGDSVVRSAIIPREAGNLMAMCDLDQVEFRFFSILSNDVGLQQTFIRADETGSDAFTEIGREVYNDPTMQKKDKRRALVKTYIYSSLYGASIKKQAISAGVPVEVMQGVSDKMNSRFPGMTAFQQSMMNKVGQRVRAEGEGYIITPTTGRRLPVEADKAYKATNFAIQSSCADIFKQNLVKLDGAGLLDNLVAPVHDEIILDAPESDIHEVMQTAHECMTNTAFAVPLTAGVDGPFTNWGGKYL